MNATGPLARRIAARRTEATCQGCHTCKWGAIVPCPTQTQKRPAWFANVTAKEMRPS